MGLKDFFSKSSLNNTALDTAAMSDYKYDDKEDRTNMTTTKRTRLPNALRTFSVISPKSKTETDNVSNNDDAADKIEAKENKKESPTLNRLMQITKSLTASKANSEDVSVPELKQEDIALRAWSIWQNNGCPGGQELQNWLQAENELKAERSR